MLLENKSNLCFYAVIDLKFEDGTVKTETFNVGDMVHIVFRRNGVRLERQGEIKRIYPSRIVESQLYGSKKLSAVLDLDCSTTAKSTMYKVDISDILDVLEVQPVEDNKCDCDQYLNDLNELF